ncbi:MAG: 2-oxoisovalerate dehydrogenase E1 subunit beta [Bacteroidales bacterium]
MKEIVFLVEESQDGGYFARAFNHSIFTQADTIEELKPLISDAVRCHFEEEEMPDLIHLHVTLEETFAL